MCIIQAARRKWFKKDNKAHRVNALLADNAPPVDACLGAHNTMLVLQRMLLCSGNHKCGAMWTCVPT